MLWVGDHRRWSETDLLLLEAFREFEKGLCKGCGHPLEETVASPEHVVHPLRFQAASVTCEACVALKNNPQSEKPAAGQMFYVVDLGEADEY